MNAITRSARKIGMALTGVVALGAATVAMAQDGRSTLDQVLERGVLLAAVRYDYPPNGYMDAEGQVQGYGPDVARELARRLGVDVRFVQETSQTRIPLLESGQVDASFGPTTPSRVRDEVVDFSLVWNIEDVVVVVQKGKPLKPEDYYGSGKVIGATQGAIFVDLWKNNDPDAEFRLFQEYPELLVAVMGGQVDAALLNGIQAREMVAKMGSDQLEVGGAFFLDPSAIMMRENDSDWRDWINWGLQRMAQDGTLGQLYTKHYGAPFEFDIWQNKMLQPGVLTIGEKGDVWKD